MRHCLSVLVMLQFGLCYEPWNVCSEVKMCTYRTAAELAVWWVGSRSSTLILIEYICDDLYVYVQTKCYSAVFSISQLVLICSCFLVVRMKSVLTSVGPVLIQRCAVCSWAIERVELADAPTVNASSKNNPQSAAAWHVQLQYSWNTE